MSGILKVGGSELINDNGGSGSLQWGSGVPANTIIQIVQTVKTDRFIGVGNQNEQLITGYNRSITPHKTGSKILVNYAFDTSASNANTARSYMERDIGGAGYAKLTGIHGDDPGGSLGDPSLSHAGTYGSFQSHRFSAMYLDSPSYTLGQAITYRIGIQSEVSDRPVYVGSTQRDYSQYHPRTASILILMEVA